MGFAHFRFDIDADGIALATWDMPGRSMNVITSQVMDEIDRLIYTVASDDAIKGCVITSGKAAFSGGADLTMLEHLGRLYPTLALERGEEAAMSLFFEESCRLSRLYRKLETCGKPFATAINGLCLGGAFELALACHYRVGASDDGKAKVGLPEVKIGLFPGGGGTTRVPRLIPPADALQMLLKGEQIKMSQAHKMGLIHATAPKAEIVESARTWIRNVGLAKAPWDQDGYKLPGGPVYSKTGMMVFPSATALYRRETYDNYPGARAILQVVYEGLQLPFDRALRVEGRHFAHVLRSQEAVAMIRTLFVSVQELGKGARRPALPRAPLRRIGVVGAGFMGAGIAYVAALAGLDVVLVDRDQAAADKGRAHSETLATRQIMKGKASAADKTALLGRIAATTDYTALKGADLIIEAVFEDRKVKTEALAKIREAVGPGTVLASNTSTLPITSLAETAGPPDNFIGIHFFSPVEKMMLVEVIRGRQTSDKTAAAALDFVKAVKKTPIVVNDGRGFFANRCVLAYVREGHIMLSQGVPPAMIETAARMAGMPVGPLALNDEIGIDLALKITQATMADLGEDAIDIRQYYLLDDMVRNENRLGRKNGKGFYDYPEKGPKRLWQKLTAAPRQDPDRLDVAELKTRFLAIQALEAARTVEEGIVTDMREADVGSILGFGFAPFTGGVISYIDGMGATAFVALCDQLATKHGKRFKPHALLRDMAAKGETFYGRFKPEEKTAA